MSIFVMLDSKEPIFRKQDKIGEMMVGMVSGVSENKKSPIVEFHPFQVISIGGDEGIKLISRHNRRKIKLSGKSLYGCFADVIADVDDGGRGYRWCVRLVMVHIRIRN